MVIGIRELKNRATQIVRAVEDEGSPVVVSRHGRPAVLILPINAPEAEDYVLSHAPEFVASLRAADRDFREGRTLALGTYRRRRGL